MENDINQNKNRILLFTTEFINSNKIFNSRKMKLCLSIFKVIFVLNRRNIEIKHRFFCNIVYLEKKSLKFYAYK